MPQLKTKILATILGLGFFLSCVPPPDSDSNSQRIEKIKSERKDKRFIVYSEGIPEGRTVSAHIYLVYDNCVMFYDYTEEGVRDLAHVTVCGNLTIVEQ